MAGGPYAALEKLRDPQLRASLKLVIDQLIELRGQVASAGTSSTVAAVADPSAPGDAVNLRTLQQYVTGALAGGIKVPAARPDPVGIPAAAGGEPPPPPSAPPSAPVPPDPPVPVGPTDPTPSPPGDGGTPTPGPSPSPSPSPSPTDPAPSPTPTPSGPFLPPQGGTGNIRIVGKTFRTPSGGYYRWRGCTDFLLFKRYLDGEDIAPILADRTGEGASLVRVLGMCVNIADFNPSNYPLYLSKLPAFAGVLAAAGVDLEFVVFADAQALPNYDSQTEQKAWLTSVRTALLDQPNVVLELVNEGFKNGVDFRNFSRPSGIVSAADAQAPAPTAGDPAAPPWDYVTLHTPRDAEWPRKSKDAMEFADQYGRPAVCDEPIGADEANIPGTRSNVPDDFYYYAATGMLLGLTGGTFHSTDGITSSLWRPTTRACAQSFFSAINVIPDSVLTGRYTRGPLADCPLQHDDALALRTFARYTASEAVCVVVRPSGSWTPVAQAGWTIASQAGPGGCVVFLTK